MKIATGGAAVFYQKQMTHHMLPDFGLDWSAACTNAFLIRDPGPVLASYVQKAGRGDAGGHRLWCSQRDC